MHLSRSFVLALSLGASASVLGGCAAAQPGRIDDAINGFYDDLRWARLQSAETGVTGALREGFSARHAGWGDAIQILDMDLGPVRMNGVISATVRARFQWNRLNDTNVRDSVIETRWRPSFTTWLCEDERVVSGDTTILALRPAPRPAPAAAASGGEARPAPAAPLAPSAAAPAVSGTRTALATP